jgi:predicted TIM-barrel fold metal-dependent hydrolase
MAMMQRRTFLGSMLAATAASALPMPVFSAGRAPFRLFDTHAHLYSGDAVRYPFRADVAAAARAKAIAHPVTPEALFAMWDSAGVETGCGVQYNTTYSTDNRYLFDSSAAHPKRIVPVVILDPLDAATPAALARMARENHISGVRFAGPPDASGDFAFLSDAAGEAWAAASRLGLVVVLMPFKTNLPQAMKRIAVLAGRYPDLAIVIDHIGFPSVATGNRFGLSPDHLALAAHKNVHYKYTTLLIEELHKQNVPADAFLQFVVETYGADHLVWGSDVGNTEGDYGTFVTRALDSARLLPLAQQKAIFHDTARRLFVPGGRPRTPA